jgi:hypothetical protein
LPAWRERGLPECSWGSKRGLWKKPKRTAIDTNAATEFATLRRWPKPMICLTSVRPFRVLLFTALIAHRKRQRIEQMR